MKLVMFIILCTLKVQAQVKVAVIDTGFDFKSTWQGLEVDIPRMCEDNKHTDFSKSGDVQDRMGHGTHVAGIIAKGNSKVNYCIYVLKYYDPGFPKTDFEKSTIKAFQMAIDLNVDVINYSGGGTDFLKNECKLIAKALDNGIVVVAAAGNEKSDLSIKPFYPAMCDDRVIKVGNIYSNGALVESSNYMRKKYIPNVVYRIGYRVKSLAPDNKIEYMTGTSMSTAVYTQEVIRQLAKKYVDTNDHLIRERYYSNWGN